MKIEDVPQDLKYLDGTVIRDLDYAVDDEGNYRAVMSSGWAPKNDALEITMDEIYEQCDEVLERVKAGETSPLEYHMTRNLMPIELLSDYSGFSKRTIRKHFDPENFAKLDDDILGKYADVLRITIDELVTVPD